MNVLRTESRSGDFVLGSQELASKEGFRNVSAIWHRQCMTFEQGRKVLTEQQDCIVDIVGPITEWEPRVINGEMNFWHRPSEKGFGITPKSVVDMAALGRGMSTFAINSMLEPIGHPTKKDADGNPITIPGGERTPDDASVLCDYVRIHFFNKDRTDVNKPRLWRTWQQPNGENSLRAILSTHYAIINNGWFLDLLAKLIPGGMLSHWKGDADTIYGNVLIPDTIRQESDSDFGGMLSIGNSEIGLRRISTIPSVFRAICMNGCIWDRKMGEALDRVHRGEINLLELAEGIKENLNTQIPLIPTFIDAVLNTRTYGMGEVPVTKLVAQLSADYSLSKKQTHTIMGEFTTEFNLLGKNDARTAYGLLNAITRAGQAFDAQTWLRFDEIAGEIAPNRNQWDAFRTRADNLSDKQVEKRFGEAVAA